MSLGLRQNPNSQAFAAGTSITPTGLTTAGWASGDIILAFVEVVSTATCTPATSTTGWNTTGTIQQGTTGVVSALFWLKYNGTSYTTPTITWTGSYKSSVKFVVISGADGTTPIGASTTNSGSGTAMTAKSSTSPRRGSVRLCMFFKATTATAFSAISSDINQLEQANVGTATSTGRFGLFAQWNMAENAAGDKLATQTTTASWVTWTVWVQPAVADQFGITRIAQAGTRGSAATSKTATLASTDVTGSNPGATIAVYGAAFNSNMTATIGGVAPTTGPGLSIGASIGIAGWYAFNQTAANGTAVNVVVTRVSGSDSIEVCAVEFLGGATSVDPIDQKGTHQSAAAATSNAVSTTFATASGTEFSVYAITDDANPGGLVADTKYNTNNSQQSGTTSAIPLLVASEQISGGSTETATSTTAASNSLALIMTFAAPASSQAISGRVSGTAPGPFALPRPPLSGRSAQSTSKTETGLATPTYSGQVRPDRVSTPHALSYETLLGRSLASQTSTEHALPSAPMNGKSTQSTTNTERATPSPPPMVGRSPSRSSAKALSQPYARATAQGVGSPQSLPSHSLIGRVVGKAVSSMAPSSHFSGSSTGRARSSINPSSSMLGRSTGKGGALATPFGNLLGRSIGKAGARSVPFGNLLGKSVGKSGALSSPLGNLLGKSSGKTAASASTLTGLLGRSVGRALSSLVTRGNLVGLSQSKPSAAASPGSSLVGKSSSKSSASMSSTGSLSGQSSGRTTSTLASASHLVGLAVGKAHSFGSVVSSAMVAITGRSVAGGAASGTVSGSMNGRSTSKPAAHGSPGVSLRGQTAGRTTAQGTFSAPNMAAMVGRSVGSAIASARSASRLSAESSGTSGARLAPSIRLAGRVGRSAGTASGSIKVLLRGLSQGYTRLNGTGAAVYRIPRRLTGTTVASESFSSTSIESVASSIEPATSEAFASSAVGEVLGVEPTLKESVSSKVRINP